MYINGNLQRVKLVKTEVLDAEKPMLERTIRGTYTTSYSLNTSGIPFLNGAFYRIGVLIRNRNPNTVNIPNSVNTPFYVESLLSVSQSNNSVTFEDKNTAIFAKIGVPLSVKLTVKDADNDQITFAIFEAGGKGVVTYLNKELGTDSQFEWEVNNASKTLIIRENQKMKILEIIDLQAETLAYRFEQGGKTYQFNLKSK